MTKEKKKIWNNNSENIWGEKNEIVSDTNDKLTKNISGIEIIDIPNNFNELLIKLDYIETPELETLHKDIIETMKNGNKSDYFPLIWKYWDLVREQMDKSDGDKKKPQNLYLAIMIAQASMLHEWWDYEDYKEHIKETLYMAESMWEYHDRLYAICKDLKKQRNA
jgi:hypothetical protein